MVTRLAATRSEELRRHNMSRLLALVHQHGEQSRADLTTALRLNRSTIGDLVADLVALGLVTERRPMSGDRAGRPSHVVVPRAEGAFVLSVDVGVEQLTLAVVGLGGGVHARSSHAVEGSGRRPDRIAARIARAGERLMKQVTDTPPVAVGVSVPGAVRRGTGTVDGVVELAPNLGWRHVAFGQQLRAKLPWDIPVKVGNDADLGAVGEHQRGAAIGLDNVIYLTGSVGIGAGIIVDGREMYGAGGFAGEIGHVTINPDGPPCHCGSTGCIETYLGEHALLRAAGVTDEHGAAALANVFAAAEAGDGRAEEGVRTTALWLGRALAILVNVFNPQAIVVGGSLSHVIRLERALMEQVLDQRAMAASRADAAILLPGLGEDSALIGAAESAFAELLAAPDLITVAAASG